jgi:DNA-binding transcriptional MerR regulator
VNDLLGAGEAAVELGVAAETLRYWERAGLLEPVGRDSGRRRRYNRADLEYLDVIRCLRLTGLPVRMVRQFSELVRRGPTTAPERLTLLQTHRAAVASSIKAQQAALAVIDAKIATYEEMTT